MIDYSKIIVIKRYNGNDLALIAENKLLRLKQKSFREKRSDRTLKLFDYI
ncbi:hypothetical protein GM3708_1041 [Geminocystis sp. NIES-3708]|nr:hypothetical protein [Geminocystis sp. NIES-3708]BAQ60635.1 hypothetical protein GM3708_1041 [Geminocystis sp. NIES-3708]